NARPEAKARKAEYNARTDVKARMAEYHAEYYEANRDKILSRMALKHSENPHVGWESTYKQRAKKFGFEPVIESFTKADLIAKYGNECFHCGGPFEQLDHAVVPVALGGHHTLENCRPSCAPCNAKGCGIRRTNTTTEKSN